MSVLSGEQAAVHPQAQMPFDENRNAGVIRRWLMFGLFIVLFDPGLFEVVPGVSTKDVFLYGLVGLTAVGVVRRGEGRWREDGKFHAVFIALIAYAALRSATAPFPVDDWQEIDPDREPGMWPMVAVLKGRWIDCFLILLVYRFGVETREDVLWLLWVCSLTLLSLCVLVVLTGLFSPSWHLEPPSFRASGWLGAGLVFFLPLAAALFELRNPGPSVRLAWLMLGAGAVLLILSGARGAGWPKRESRCGNGADCCLSVCVCMSIYLPVCVCLSVCLCLPPLSPAEKDKITAHYNSRNAAEDRGCQGMLQ